MQSAWTGPLAPARFACTGLDTSLAQLALTVLLNATRSVKLLNLSLSSKQSFGWSSYKVPSLSSQVGHVVRPLLVELKSMLLQTFGAFTI